MTTYPELEKLQAVKEKSQEIGFFLEMLLGKYTLCEFKNEETWYDQEFDEEFSNPEGYYPIRRSIQDLLAEYFEIDMDKVEAERRQILKELAEQARKI